VIYSNSPAVQPKEPTETQPQFNQLLTALSIPLTLSPNEKLARLRSLPPRQLLDAAKTIPIHQFRPTTDGAFILPTLFRSLDDGTFARKIVARNIRLILGECSEEHFLYAVWYPPKTNTLDALRTRLIADYPQRIVDALLPLHYPDGKLPPGVKNWNSDAWGRIYADMQVYHMQRGLIYALTSNTAGVDASRLIHRYRIEFQAECAKGIPVEWGVTHSSDYPLWFWGNGDVLTDREKGRTWEALVGPLARFVKAEDDFGWETSGKMVRVLKADGSLELREDPLWDEGVRVWKALRDVHEKARF